MSAASIVLALIALACVGVGVLTTPVPVVGTVFSFAAPTLALAGIVLGGLALSRARRDGRPADAAWAGIVLGVLAFLPAVLVAITCGVCNALFTAGGVQVRRDFDLRVGQGARVAAPDAGVRPGLPAVPPFPIAPQAAPTSPPGVGSGAAPGADPAGVPGEPAAATPAPAAPTAPSAPADVPPPAMPPPPWPPSPGVPRTP